MRDQVDHAEWDRFVESFRIRTRTRKDDISKALADAAELVLKTAKSVYLTGKALKVRTGRLRSSVTKDPASGARVSANRYMVSVGTDVVYGAIHEFGGTIVAKTAKGLVFPILPRGSKAWSKGMNVPWARVQSVTIPARPWLAPSFEDNEMAVIRILEKVGLEFEK